MKKILLLILFPGQLFSQITINATIINRNHEPLAFTNIVTTKGRNGTISNEIGQFTISNVYKTDTLKITNVAYLPVFISVNEIIQNDTIVLVEVIKELAGVTVRNWNSYKQKVELGFFHHSNHGEFTLLPGSQIATFIENVRQKEGILEGIYFRLKKTGKCKNSLRIRILKMDSFSLQPAIDLLNENIVIPNINLKTKNYFDLRQHRIILPPDGFFLVLELLFPDKNCETSSFTSISATLTVPKNVVWLNFRDSKWNNIRPKLPNGNYMTPNISAKIAFQ
jgi:hypothetical protein